MCYFRGCRIRQCINYAASASAASTGERGRWRNVWGVALWYRVVFAALTSGFLLPLRGCDALIQPHTLCVASLGAIVLLYRGERGARAPWVLLGGCMSGVRCAHTWFSFAAARLWGQQKSPGAVNGARAGRNADKARRKRYFRTANCHRPYIPAMRRNEGAAGELATIKIGYLALSIEVAKIPPQRFFNFAG